MLAKIISVQSSGEASRQAYGFATMRNIGKIIGNEHNVGEIQTPLGTAACVLLNDGNVLMNLHMVFRVNDYKYRSQTPESASTNLNDFFCDVGLIKASFVHDDKLFSCSFNELVCCGLSTIQHAGRDFPKNWDYVVLRPSHDLRSLLRVSGLKFSSLDHTSITNMLLPTQYIYAPILNFEDMTYSYNTQLHSPNAVDPSIGRYTAILPTHSAERTQGSSGSIALQNGELFLFNFQRGRLLPGVHLGHDIQQAKKHVFDPFRAIDFSSVDTKVLTGKPLKSNVKKEYETKLASKFDLNNEKLKYHFAQLINNTDSTTFDHFLYELTHDYNTKSLPKDNALTTQELYLTTYGWNARVKYSISTEPRTLLLYRVVTYDDMKALAKGNTSVLRGHMGDYKQALTYLFGNINECRVLMEFSVDAKELFSPKNIALPSGNKLVSNTIKEALKKEYAGTYDISCGSEGKARDDKFGMKEEAKGDVGFSITFSSTSTHDRLKCLLSGMRPVLWTGEDGRLNVTADGLEEKWQDLQNN